MRTYKKLFSAAAVLFMLLTAALPAAAREVITKYNADIRIERDSSMTVTEDITVIVEHQQINKGIIRVFPVEYYDDSGNRFNVVFDVLEVKIDGKTTESSISSEGRYREVRIGDPKTTLSRGEHTFTITYRTMRQIGFFEKHDELYWNVTGNDWEFPIMSASCRVALPGRDFGEGFDSIEWYTGRYGQKGTPDAARLTADGTVTTTKALWTREGLTVVFTWPKGLVTPPPPLQDENLTAMSAVGLILLLLVTLWTFYAVRKWGKYPQENAIIPLFYPPGDISPGYCRFVYKGLRTDQTAFAAALLGLAVKGAIKIREEVGGVIFKNKDNIILEKEEKPRIGLDQQEEEILWRLFPDDQSKTLTLKQANRERLTSAKNSLNRFVSRQRAELMRKNTLKMLPATLLYIFGVAALYPFRGDFFPQNMVISAIPGSFLIITVLIGTRSVTRSGFARMRRVLVRLVPAIIGCAALASLGGRFLPSMLFVAVAGIIFAVSPLLSVPTQKGSELMNGVDGLRLYMVTAEKDRLEMLNPPEETPMLFERLLPYALALDAAKTWASRFEKILTKAQYEPTWYVGPSSHMFITRNGFNNFASNLQDQMNSSMRTPSSAPGSSSGSGGSGFSGGGGGGGGGRGW